MIGMPGANFGPLAERAVYALEKIARHLTKIETHLERIADAAEIHAEEVAGK